MKWAFEVLGSEPLPKQSFRFSKTGGYQPQRIKDWEELVATFASMAVKGGPYSDCFEVALTFYRKTKRKTDLDNLSKAVLDALNGIVWEDDRQVMRLHITKRGVAGLELAGVRVEIWSNPEEHWNGECLVERQQELL